MLVNQRRIGIMPRDAVLSETPAYYDRVDDLEYSNPLYGARESEGLEKEDLGDDGDSFDNGDGDEDDEGYTKMAYVPLLNGLGKFHRVVILWVWIAVQSVLSNSSLLQILALQ